MTIENHLIAWTLDMRAQSLSERTIKERVRIVRQFTAAFAISSNQPSPESITTFLAQSHLKPASRDTYYRALRAWFTWQQKQQFINASPMEQVGRPRIPPSSPRPAPLVHVDRVLSSGIRTATRMKILLATWAGLRVHEIARFKGEHLDLPNETMTVSGKGGRIDTLPVHSIILDEAKFFPDHGYWFPSPVHPDQPIRPDSVSTAISHAFARIDTDITAHQLRHTFATELLYQGVDVRIVQTLMRHESLSTTARYTFVNMQQQRTAIDTLAPARTATLL